MSPIIQAIVFAAVLFCSYLGAALIALVVYDEHVTYSPHDYRNLTLVAQGSGFASMILATVIVAVGR